MMNPNNSTAKYYNKIYRHLKGPEITDAELSLINHLAESGSKILDVGGGTGRHSIPLSKQGFLVTILDSSRAMIEEALKESTIELKIIENDIFNFETSEKYELIILMWNTFNEIALSEKRAEELLFKLKSLLSPSGQILINIDDATIVDPANFDFALEIDDLKVHWHTISFDKNTNTSLSLEEIFENNELIAQAEIKQRYWSIDEIKSICDKLKLEIKSHKLSSSSELYLSLIKG